jgi:RNA-directed DNA polymerase
LEKAFARSDGPGTWAKAKLVRYADDFVILARHQTGRLQQWIEGTLEGRFRLTINREKTRVVKLTEPGESLSFLGFTLRYDADRFGRPRRYLNVFPSKKALERARVKLRELTDRRHNHQAVETTVSGVSRWLASWGDYFRHGYPSEAFAKLNWFAIERLKRHLQRRSNRPYRVPEGESFYAHLKRLGFRRLGTTRG